WACSTSSSRATPARPASSSGRCCVSCPSTPEPGSGWRSWQRHDPSIMTCSQRLTVAALVVVLLIAGCTRRARPVSPVTPPVAAPAASGLARFPTVRFTDVSQRAGIRFRHTHGGFGKKYMPEAMGPGCAFLDFDNDGWLDILLLNGRPL